MIAGFLAAWTAQFLLMAGTAIAVRAARPRLRGRWYGIHSWESAVYRRLGVSHFQRLLRAVGWQRLNPRPFDGTRASLAAFDRAARESEFAHLILAAVSVLPAAGAAVPGLGHAAGWLLVLAVPFHVWPVLLQRALRARIDRLRRRH